MPLDLKRAIELAQPPPDAHACVIVYVTKKGMKTVFSGEFGAEDFLDAAAALAAHAIRNIDDLYLRPGAAHFSDGEAAKLLEGMAARAMTLWHSPPTASDVHGRKGR